MTASPTTTLPNPRGTAFDPKRENLLRRSDPFTAREADAEYEPIEYTIEEGWPAARAHNAKALRRIALEVLSEPRLTDPNVRYAEATLRSRLDELHLETADHNLCMEAFREGVKHAALAVAAAWLQERGSLPIPGDRP